VSRMALLSRKIGIPFPRHSRLRMKYQMPRGPRSTDRQMRSPYAATSSALARNLLKKLRCTHHGSRFVSPRVLQLFGRNAEKHLLVRGLSQTDQTRTSTVDCRLKLWWYEPVSRPTRAFPGAGPALGQADDFRALNLSKVRLIWITPKAELHTTKMRIIGFGVQTDVHRRKVNIPPSALDRVGCRKARRPA
jgi:hypothetical protein